MKDIIARINELAKLSKERELTPEEFIERERLRKEYIENIKGSTRSILMNATIKDSEGNDVTPQKLRDAQQRAKNND